MVTNDDELSINLFGEGMDLIIGSTPLAKSRTVRQLDEARAALMLTER